MKETKNYFEVNGKIYGDALDWNNAMALSYLNTSGIDRVKNLCSKVLNRVIYTNKTEVQEAIKKLHLCFHCRETGNIDNHLDILEENLEGKSIISVVVNIKSDGRIDKTDFMNLTYSDLNELGLKAIGSKLDTFENDELIHNEIDKHFLHLIEGKNN